MLSFTSKYRQRKIQRGVFSRLLLGILPMLRSLEKWQLLQFFSPIFLKLVRLYQTRVSPHKGFSCAHRKLHQQASCSEYFALNLQNHGIIQAIPLQLERFQDCKQANRILKAHRLQLMHQNLSQSLSSQSKRKKRNTNECDALDCSGGCCDISLCDCDGLDCDFPDLDCDCNDVPCDLDCDCG